jgi:hypothetical protein
MASYGYIPGGDEGFGDDRDELGTPLFEVELCSGEKLPVMTEVEQRWFVDTKTKYLSQNKFTDVTDLQDMDRLLGLELMMFRWTQFLSAGVDYHRNIIDDELVRKQIKEQSDAITKLKTSLGLDKKAREAALNEGNFHTWFMDVKRRAKIFGIHRENQLNVALSLMNELSGIVGAYDRSDEEERKKLGFETEGHILAWIRESMIPQFKEVDEHFVNNEQKMWKRDL